MAFSISRLLLKNEIHHSMKLFSNTYVTTGINMNRQCLTTYNKLSSFSPFVTVKNYSRMCSREIHKYSLFNNISRQILIESKTCSMRVLCSNLPHEKKMLINYYSTNNNEDESKKVSKKEQFKKAVKEYGATVIVFHVAISLLSLGCCYLAVTSGLNVKSYVPIGFEGSSELAADAGMFVVAYAVHKVLAPLRITITLFSAPFIVRYLRKINVLKQPNH